MPLEAPVTTATLSVNLAMPVLSCFGKLEETLQ
jgi:hypothetical protein